MEYIQKLSYQEHKSMIKSGLNRIVEDFIEIGYHLKQVRDRQLFREDGYENINEFAKDEYGLSQSNTSRFISITECYSIDGNSPKLLPEFEGYGSSKLSEMLSLTPEEMKLVSIRTTVAEIRTLKEAKKEAELNEYSDNYATSHNAETLENTQSEVASESEEKEIIPGGKKLIIDFFREKTRRNTLIELGKILREGTVKGSITEAIAEVINPSGHLMFRKVANILIFEAEIIKHSKFGAGGVKEITYMDFLHDIALVFDMAAEDPWVMFYGEPEPEHEPKQESKPKPKQEPKPKPKQEPKPVEPITIDDLDFTVRTYNCLKRAGVDTIEQLCNLTRNDVASIRKFSHKCLDEIYMKLSGIGRCLKEEHLKPDDEPDLVEITDDEFTQPEETEEVEVVEADIVMSSKNKQETQMLTYTVVITEGVYELTALHELINSIIQEKTECKIVKSRLESDDEMNEIGW